MSNPIRQRTDHSSAFTPNARYAEYLTTVHQMLDLFIPSDIMSNGVRCVNIFGLPQIRPHKTHRSSLWRRSEFSPFQIFCFLFYYSSPSVLPFHIFLSVSFLLLLSLFIIFHLPPPLFHFLHLLHVSV